VSPGTPLAGPLVACALLAGCLASSVVEPAARGVQPAEEQRVWRPAASDELPGLYSSVSIEGPAAAVLREVHYWIGPSDSQGGRFTGAALFAVPELHYEVLEGRWRLEQGALYLGEDAASARAETSADLLRITGDEGTVVLRRREP
jgi:hypothetical protein